MTKIEELKVEGKNVVTHMHRVLGLLIELRKEENITVWLEDDIEQIESDFGEVEASLDQLESDLDEEIIKKEGK